MYDWFELVILRPSHLPRYFKPTTEKILQSWKELNNDYGSFAVATIGNDTIV